jgi:ligand-binding sensor domain-containing protein
VCIYKFFGWFVFFLFCGVVSQGQTRPIFQRLDSSNGLSSARVTGIAKEKGGFVWISTQYGLNRYDGHSVKVYTKQNSQLPTNDIAGLYLDRQNRLWITTLGRGLVLYDAAKDDFITYKQDDDDLHSIASNRINAVLEDANY